MTLMLGDAGRRVTGWRGATGNWRGGYLLSLLESVLKVLPAFFSPQQAMIALRMTRLALLLMCMGDGSDVA